MTNSIKQTSQYFRQEDRNEAIFTLSEELCDIYILRDFTVMLDLQ